MTTPAQLLDLAQKHEHDAGVRVLLLSIKEASAQATAYLKYTESRVQSLHKAVSMQEDYRVRLDNTTLVSEAASAAAYLTRLASDLANLACVLETLGESISY